MVLWLCNETCAYETYPIEQLGTKTNQPINILEMDKVVFKHFFAKHHALVSKVCKLNSIKLLKAKALLKESKEGIS